MRWLPFVLWIAVTVVLIMVVLSDFLFGKGDAKRLGIRIALAFVWPLAALSRPGRDVLFKEGKKL